MSNDNLNVLVVTTATAIASVISFYVLTTAAKAEKLKAKGISMADFLNRGESNEGSTKKDTIMSTENEDSRNEDEAEMVSSPDVSFKSDWNYSGDNDSDISFDSDSDLSYDSESSMTFKNLLISLLESETSLKGLVLEPDLGKDDNIFDPKSQLNQCIYLDYNGTTPIDRRVFAAMIPYLTLHFGNPSSSHFYGAFPKRAISRARRSILGLLYPNSSIDLDDETVEESIVFTGCGTEADNMAIYLALNSTPTKKRKKKHIVTTNVEHPAIAECLKVLEAKGEIDVTYVPVNSEGIVSAKNVITAITNDTVLVTIMLANNESGALQPVREIAPYCRKRGILFHTDAAQAVGKVSIALDKKGISDTDMVTIVGHKFGAPKGIACLYIRPGCLNEKGRTEPKTFGYGSSGILLRGGGQEKGRRAGTENVAYIVGMGCAASILNTCTSKDKLVRWKKNASKMRMMRSRLLSKFKAAFESIGGDIVRENGPTDPNKRLPNTLSIGFKDVHSGELLQNIQSVVACSAGSACHASGSKVSSVLVAMKVPDEYARGTLRLSVGPTTKIDEVDKAAEIIIKEIRRQLKTKIDTSKS